MLEGMKGLAGLLALAALVAAAAAPCATVAQQQTFKSISSGTPPAPLPTPSSWPYLWEGVTYYPPYWPVCSTGHTHCRPQHGPVWPPRPVPQPHPPQPPPPPRGQTPP